jgi:hypothetical protein
MNKKAVKLASEQNLKDIQNKLINICAQCKERQVREELNMLRAAIEKQCPAELAEALDGEQQVITILGDIAQDIAKGSYGSADLKIRKIAVLLSDRSALCPESGLTATKEDSKLQRKAAKANAKRLKQRAKRRKKGLEVDSTYTNEELLNMKLLQALDDYDKAELLVKDLHERLVENPDDKNALSQWKPAVAKMKTADKNRQIISDEILRQSNIDSMQAVQNTYKSILAMRTVSDPEVELMFKKYKETMEEEQESSKKTNEMYEALNGTSAAESAEVAATTTVKEGSAVTSEEQKIKNEIFNSAEFKALGSAKSDDEKQRTDIINNPDKYLAQIEQSIQKLDEYISDVEAEHERSFAKTRELLIQLKESDPSKSKRLQDKINESDATCSGLEHTLNRCTNKMSKLIENRNTLQSLKTDKELKKMSDSTLINNDTLSSLAMNVVNNIKSANKELEDAGTINAVIDSEEINTESMSGIRQGLSRDNAKRDEEHIQELNKKYGVE